MANNRYFVLCPCRESHYFGKSLGDGIYSVTGDVELLTSLRDWMWEHLMDNHAGLHKEDDVLSPEWVGGEIFKVITEYDDRAPGGQIPPLIQPARQP